MADERKIKSVERQLTEAMLNVRINPRAIQALIKVILNVEQIKYGLYLYNKTVDIVSFEEKYYEEKHDVSIESIIEKVMKGKV